MRSSQRAVAAVTKACARHGKAWGLPVTAETAPGYLRMGATFLAAGADALGLSQYSKEIRMQFEKIGFEFAESPYVENGAMAR